MSTNPTAQNREHQNNAAIVRVDRYTIEVNDARVRATADQERQIRSLTPEALDRFLRIMGAKP